MSPSWKRALTRSLGSQFFCRVSNEPAKYEEWEKYYHHSVHHRCSVFCILVDWSTYGFLTSLIPLLLKSRPGLSRAVGSRRCPPIAKVPHGHCDERAEGVLALWLRGLRALPHALRVGRCQARPAVLDGLCVVADWVLLAAIRPQAGLRSQSTVWTHTAQWYSILTPSYHPTLDLVSSSTTVSELYSYPSGHSFASTVAWFTVADHLAFPTWYALWSRLRLRCDGELNRLDCWCCRDSLSLFISHLQGTSDCGEPRLFLAHLAGCALSSRHCGWRNHGPDLPQGVATVAQHRRQYASWVNIWCGWIFSLLDSTSLRRSLIGHWLLIISILYSNYHFYDTILQTAPTGMLFGPIFCLGLWINWRIGLLVRLFSSFAGILVGISLHTPWVGVKNTYLEGFLRYLVGMNGYELDPFLLTC